MEKLKLRSYVIPTLTTVFVFSLLVSSFFMNNSSSFVDPSKYVSDVILGNKIPVINEKETLINPYTAADVTVSKKFYDFKATEEDQKNSIVKYDDTYMQNTGVDYTSENIFDVISILNGEVISISEDDTLGNVVKIEHENGYISVYQSLSQVSVEKGEKVQQGQVIGKSGENKLDQELGNHLHFELYINSQMVDPMQYLNKSLEN